MIHYTNTNLNRIASTSTSKFATRVGNWNLFQQRVQHNSQQWTDLVNRATTKEQLDKSVTTIWSKLGLISKKCFPPFLPKTKYTPWWSPKLNALRKQVNALKRRVKRCKNADLKEIFNTRFKHHKNQYKSELLKAEQDFRKKFCTESTKITSWKMYKTCKAGFARQAVLSSLSLPDGSVTTSEKETANALLHKFFPDDLTAQDSKQQGNIRAQILELGPPDSQTEPIFTKHEVDEVIKKYRR